MYQIVLTKVVGTTFHLPTNALETGINIFRFQDCQLAEMWCQMSDLSVYNQLKPL